MIAGTLMDRAEIIQPVSVRTETGSESIIYQSKYSRRVQVGYDSGTRENTNGDIFFTSNITFTFRVGIKVDENDRVFYNNQSYRILHIERNNRQQYIKLFCELINE